MTDYAELQVTTNFSFLTGASHPEEFVWRAAELGYFAIGITDRNTLAGVVRAHLAAKEAGIRLVVGARLDLRDGSSFLCFPRDRAAYGRLARLLTLGLRRAPKGACRLDFDDLLAHKEGQILVGLSPARPDSAFADTLGERKGLLGRGVRLYLAARSPYRGDDARRLAELSRLSEETGIPLVATNDARAHDPARRPLQDVLACIREKCTVDEAGFRLSANAEAHLKPPEEMRRLFRSHPEAIPRTREIAEAAAFSLDALRYEYPDETVPNGRTPQEELARLAREGARERYPAGVPEKVRGLVERELALIAELDYAPYFLTVHDIVRFARGRRILCQGRGSAANSAVCYCLGITAVDPERIDLLFERFVSAERGEPPDIDVDFEHERREEVIQYIYEKYGRDRAGLAATVVSYRWKSAIREVGKALGLSEDTVAALAGMVFWGRRGKEIPARHVREIGLDPTAPRLRLALRLAAELVGFPRHLSQHVGGFVITRGPLSEVVPIANAAMAGRTMIEWDKDDLDALGILKVDVLSLGMLTCIRKALELLARHHDRPLTLARVPAEDPAVYDMLSKADAIGVFQVESRAQMAMLPRLRPRSFYDLVIEVAIVRPGPIQGNMVHPYLRRRNGEEPVEYPSAELRSVLGKTLGVPLFQEQAMRLAVVAAGFAPAAADGLRRAMATFRRTGRIHLYRRKFIDGMTARGYAPAFAERCFKQIEGFGEYGFPESHAASFALLSYVSAWLKRHYPAAFACALLNSQPMGFYAPAQIVRDAREHGVDVRPVDVNRSDWDCTLEAEGDGKVALRLGFRMAKGFPEEAARRLVAARGNGYPDARTVWRRAGLSPAVLERLARADAFRSLGLDRREALWAVRGLGAPPLPLFAATEARGTSAGATEEPRVELPRMPLGEHVIRDYATLRLSLKAHPLAFLRDSLAAAGFVRAADLAVLPDLSRVKAAGLVIIRQRPATANGIIFLTIEDETGIANLVVRVHTFERFHREVMASTLLGVEGRLEREGLVIHVLAERLFDLTPRLAELYHADSLPPPSGLRNREVILPRSRDFH